MRRRVPYHTFPGRKSSGSPPTLSHDRFLSACSTAPARPSLQRSFFAELREAIVWRDVAGVRLLLSLQADVNLPAPKTGQTHLMRAAGVNNVELLRMLIAAGAKVNLRDQWGLSALSYAVHFPPNLRLLIEAGANVNTRDLHKNTTLMMSALAFEVPVESVRVLLEAGANVNLRNEDGETALSLLLSAGPGCLPWIDAQRTEKRLLLEQAGATI